MNEWTTKIYTRFDEQLETVWKKLELQCRNYLFQSYDWIHQWQQTIGNELKTKPFIVTVRHRGQVVALFPMAVRRSYGISVLGFLGGEQSDYNSPLIVKHYLCAERLSVIWPLVNDVLPSHDIIIFSRLPQFLSEKENYLCSIWGSKQVTSSYASILPRSITEFQAQIPKRIRSDNKRQVKRLKKIGSLTFIVAKSQDVYDKLIDSMILQKRYRYQSTGVRDILSGQAAKDFYKKIELNPISKVRIHLSALMLNENVLATHWGAIYNDRFYFLMPSYSNEWERFSPGRLLLLNLIEWSIDQGLQVFDFTVGEEDYKKKYCGKEMKIYEHLKVKTPLGVIYLFVRGVIVFLKNNLYCRRVITLLISMIRRLSIRPS